MNASTSVGESISLCNATSLFVPGTNIKILYALQNYKEDCTLKYDISVTTMLCFDSIKIQNSYQGRPVWRSSKKWLNKNKDY